MDWVDEGHRSWRWKSWFAWRPIKTFDAGWIWLRPYWRWQCSWGWGFFDDYPYLNRCITYLVGERMVDWDKPIQFENGDPCHLLETRPEGWRQWGARSDGTYPTRMIQRDGVDTSTTGGAMSALWFMHEDGKSNWPGFNVINKTD